MIHKLAYYWPGFHPNADLSLNLGKTWCEWDLVKSAKPFFPCHYQPRVPLWGYEDETDYAVMRRKLRTAKEYNVDSVLFCNCWYLGKSVYSKPFEIALEIASEEGYSQPSMLWANNNRYHAYPENASEVPRVHLVQDYSWPSCKRMINYWVANYFSHRAYFKLPDGKLFFSIYSPQSAINATNSLTPLINIIEYLRDSLRKKRLPEVHLHACETRFIQDLAMLKVGFDSCSDYLSLGYSENIRGKEPHLSLPSLYGSLFVNMELSERQQNIKDTYRTLSRSSFIDYFPVVTVGHDCSPRVDRFSQVRRGHYSTRPILQAFHPEEFRQHCRLAKEFVNEQGYKHALVFLNAWNEWTEGAYLEPDTKFQYGFLDVIREVFDERQQ